LRLGPREHSLSLPFLTHLSNSAPSPPAASSQAESSAIHQRVYQQRGARPRAPHRRPPEPPSTRHAADEPRSTPRRSRRGARRGDHHRLRHVGAGRDASQGSHQAARRRSEKEQARLEKELADDGGGRSQEAPSRPWRRRRSSFASHAKAKLEARSRHARSQRETVESIERAERRRWRRRRGATSSREDGRDDDAAARHVEQREADSRLEELLRGTQERTARLDVEEAIAP